MTVRVLGKPLDWSEEDECSNFQITTKVVFGFVSVKLILMEPP